MTLLLLWTAIDVILRKKKIATNLQGQASKYFFMQLLRMLQNSLFFRNYFNSFEIVFEKHQ